MKKRRQTLIIRDLPPRPEQVTHVVDLRVALKGHPASAEDNSYLQELLDNLRQVGAVEVVREGIIMKEFDSWNCRELRGAIWEDSHEQS